MATRRFSVLIFVVVVVGAAALSTVHARQTADRAVFQSLEIVLPVTDLNRSIDFYRTVLEFEPANVIPTVRRFNSLADAARGRANDVAANQVIFSVGGQHLRLQQGANEQPRDGTRLIVHVANPGDYAARLRTRGAAVSVELIDSNRQPLAFTVVDPDGYRLYFTGNAAAVPQPR